MTTDLAPHETGALVRMHDAGWTIPDMSKITGLSVSKVMSEMRRELEEREQARRQGRPVHA
jgi:DNA-directed RNA polymerase specialized sigma24 family protein